MAQATVDEAKVRQGVENLVRNCVAVEKGESILLLNEKGRAERELVALIEDTIKENGGVPYSLWIDPLERGLSGLPSFLGDSIVAADKLVMNCNLNRVILLDYLKEKGREDLIRINNRNQAAGRMATEHARVHWGLVMALCQRIEEFTAGSTYHVTTPYGTDISGRIVSGSEVAGAFFVQDAEASRNERVFPGEVYTPVGSADAKGTLAWDHPGITSKERFPNPIIIHVDDNRVADVEWREEAEPSRSEGPGTGSITTRAQLMDALAKQQEAYGEAANVIDSWHGGMHPKAEKLAGQQSDMMTMHFHIGRAANTLSATMSDQSVTVDGKPFWENGRCVLLGDPAIKEMAKEFGVELP